jgi:rare lipoprotein A
VLKPGPRGGAFYKDDGPGASAPPGLDRVPDADPQVEPLHRFANRPYVVFGREYVPATALRPYRERGLASWYGRKFHGEKTSTGDTYDMYAMTAAHPTLPLPSYARVTSRVNGRSVIVRVNDRGPFHPGRIIDLSYTAALRLGILERGSGEVEVESILFGMDDLLAPLPAVALTEARPAELPVREDAGGHYVQLGAFANRANAENFVAHIANPLRSAGAQTRVRHDQGMFRVLVGPYPDRPAAQRASLRVREAIGIDGIVRAQ